MERRIDPWSIEVKASVGTCSRDLELLDLCDRAYTLKDGRIEKEIEKGKLK